MAHVRVLSEALANRIAAGEVVERPASVVKELVENAVDAGARRVEVELVDGGRGLIRVTDDGHGMSAEDARLAVQRFATSKIASADDLDSIETMGFRGEALPSIAAVSRFRLVSREPGSEEGCEVTIQGGSDARVLPVGCPSGTTVEVADLFFNTPARAKFLSTTARERGHCADWVSRLAMARPDVAFKLTHNGEVLFTTSGAGDLRSVIAAMYGSAAAREFLEVDLERDGVRVHGLVSRPTLLRSTRSHQMFFVNRRFVRSRQMSHALDEAYGLLLPAGRHSLCALHLDVEPTRVDPNVHPTKIEVRFREGGAVHSLVQAAVEDALAEAGFRSLSQGSRHIYHRPTEGDELGVPGTEPFGGDRFGAGLPAGRAPLGDLDQRMRARRLRVNPFEDRVDDRDEGLGVFADPIISLPAEREPAVPALELATERGQVEVLGQLAGRYIVARSPEGLLLIDQHRAAERVILESLSPERVTRQLLVVPETLQLAPGEMEVARASLGWLGELGYELEDFGPGAFLVRSVPASTAELAPIETLRNAIAELADAESTPSLDRRREKLRATLACHAAVKAGERMGSAAMQKLVDDLLKSEAPAVCPHGDPIIVSFGLDRLDRQFRRNPGSVT
ncbi:MAG: DNA mismatch repair endonuclease MutL [Acidobacteriota bacterium]|nr:DNA mismatch repair endonuclease MutL [Acidobacteriota bacterium]